MVNLKEIHQRKPISRDINLALHCSVSARRNRQNHQLGYRLLGSAYKPAAIVALILMAALPASATPVVDVLGVAGIWTAAAPPVPSLTGLGTSEIRWGTSGIQPGQSGYRFDGAPAVSGIPLDTPFLLGTFTHFNVSINPATAITGATLDVGVDLMVWDSGFARPVSLLSEFDVTHDETLNRAPCVPASVSECDDIVQFLLNVGQSTGFIQDGVSYLVDMTGFLVGNSLVALFLTQEEHTNVAHLQGIVTASPLQVPLPMTLLLMLAGCACLAWRRV